MADEEPKQLGILKLLTTYAAVLAAFGYMSLRAHLNYLGISAAAPITFDRYLMETYVIVFAIVVRLCVFAVIGLLLAGVVAGLRKLVHRWRPPKRRSSEWIKSTTMAIASAAFILIVLLVLLGLIATQLGVVVGRLDVTTLSSRPRWIFDAALFIAVAGLLVRSVVIRSALPQFTKYLWKIAAIPWMIIVALLPTFYGACARPASFPRCRVFLKGGAGPLCGLLIESTEKQKLIWSAEAGVGRLIALPTEAIAQFSLTKPTDILQEAKAAARPNASPAACE